MVTVRRPLAGLLVVAMLMVVGLASLAQAHHNWNCRDVDLTPWGSAKIKRTVCYPCPIAELPEGTPQGVVLLWEQEICAPVN